MSSFIRVPTVRVFLNSNRNPETGVGTRDWGIAVIDLSMILVRGLWVVGPWIRKAVGQFKWI